MADVTDLPLYSSRLELSRDALQNNIQFLRTRAGKGVTFSSVIKGNAYGHGIATFLPMAEECGVSHFSVFSSEEAVAALEAKLNPETRIMIMGMVDDAALGWAIEHEVSFYIFDMGRLLAARNAAERAGKPARIHIQLETGMHRLGFLESEYEELIRFLKENHGSIVVEGVCTHFAGAESVANYVRIRSQQKRFRKGVKAFQKVFPEIPYIHAASSAALLAYPDHLYSMVRVGIAQYGFWPSREVYMLLQKENDLKVKDPLKRVIRWSSKIMSLKSVGEGEFVGYGTMYMTTRRETIATVPIGYSHGFGRNLTNMGYVLVRGLRAPVVGLVNMNMLTIDVTDIPGVSRGDEVVIIGRQEEGEITVASFGEMSNNLNYEVLTRLPEGLPRSVVE
ncbi:MAG: alanine racemase [Balneolaceae bacterium]